MKDTLGLCVNPAITSEFTGIIVTPVILGMDANFVEAQKIQKST